MISMKTAFVSIVLFSISFSCKAFELLSYIGIDGQLNRMHFKEGYGNNLFPRHYPQINVYGGLKYDNSFAIEAGYLSEAVKSKYTTLYEGEHALGALVPATASPAVFKTYIKIRGYHLGFVNTFCQPQWDSFRVLWGAGVGFLRAESQRDCKSMGNPPTKGNIRKFKKDKAVLRLMLSSEYKFKNNLGFRASLFFLQTSQMVIKAQPLEGHYTPTIKPKDSFVYSMGIFYEF